MVELIRQLHLVSGMNIELPAMRRPANPPTPAVDQREQPLACRQRTSVWTVTAHAGLLKAGSYSCAAYRVQLANQLHHAHPLSEHAERTLKVSLAMDECSFCRGCIGRMACVQLMLHWRCRSAAAGLWRAGQGWRRAGGSGTTVPAPSLLLPPPRLQGWPKQLVQTLLQP
jgi:hypothetical protein